MLLCLFYFDLKFGYHSSLYFKWAIFIMMSPSLHLLVINKQIFFYICEIDLWLSLYSIPPIGSTFRVHLVPPSFHFLVINKPIFFLGLWYSSFDCHSTLYLQWTTFRVDQVPAPLFIFYQQTNLFPRFMTELFDRHSTLYLQWDQL